MYREYECNFIVNLKSSESELTILYNAPGIILMVFSESWKKHKKKRFLISLESNDAI